MTVGALEWKVVVTRPIGQPQGEDGQARCHRLVDVNRVEVAGVQPSLGAFGRADSEIDARDRAVHLDRQRPAAGGVFGFDQTVAGQHSAGRFTGGEDGDPVALLLQPTGQAQDVILHPSAVGTSRDKPIQFSRNHPGKNFCIMCQSVGFALT